ncbi:MAG: HAMP domain-containing protein [Chloroflexi bacterium]|nr:HAMP domain-containing protein [Chloroflexota bacterium]
MLKALRNLEIPILTKITVPYVILALIIAAGGSYIISRVIIDSVEERFTNQLIETGLLASESIVREEEKLLEDLRQISHVQGMADAVERSEVGIIQQLVLPSAYNSNVPALGVLNRFGNELLLVTFDEETQVYVPLNTRVPLSQVRFVQSVIARQEDEFGDKFGGVLETDQGSYFFVAGPIEDVDGVLKGIALVGVSQENLVLQVRQETLAQLSFYDLDGNLLTSTLGEGAPLVPEDAQTILAQQAAGSQLRSFEDSGIAYNELLTSFEIREGQDLGIMGVALPTSFLTQASEITRSNTLILMAGVLLLVIVVGVFVAGRITRPILDLRDAAEQISLGNLTVRVSSRSRDEVSELANSFNEMVDSINKSKRDLIEAYDKTIEGWAMALDLRDRETQGHSKRVAEISTKLAKRMGIEGEALENLTRGALLHDIGKIGVADSILLKKGKLSAKERATMQLHPEHGRAFMEEIDFLKPALDIPYSHHEKWDGSGYPQGLEGKKIPLAARIFAIVDVWDAITSDRPYRKAMPFKKAKAIIEVGRESHFDPEVVDAFLELLAAEKIN